MKLKIQIREIFCFLPKKNSKVDLKIKMKSYYGLKSPYDSESEHQLPNVQKEPTISKTILNLQQQSIVQFCANTIYIPYR